MGLTKETLDHRSSLLQLARYLILNEALQLVGGHVHGLQQAGNIAICVCICSFFPPGLQCPVHLMQLHLEADVGVHLPDLEQLVERLLVRHLPAGHELRYQYRRRPRHALAAENQHTTAFLLCLADEWQRLDQGGIQQLLRHVLHRTHQVLELVLEHRLDGMMDNEDVRDAVLPQQMSIFACCFSADVEEALVDGVELRLMRSLVVEMNKEGKPAA
mmetsp:Transcript_21075/g.60203  ORF Transcript_21075/g.60203 Transcript_21075/m.60203 type:complete len:216 (-) Transcript_21075:19-666(-)